MADPLTTTTLVLMYFITPPAEIPKGQSKIIQESKAVWTLQSADHIDTPDAPTCITYAQKLMAAIDKVNTLTLRAYCLCPKGDGKEGCFGPDAKTLTLGAPGVPTLKAIGPKTPAMNVAPGAAPLQ